MPSVFLNWTCIWAFYWLGVYTRCSPTPLQANAPHAWPKVPWPSVFVFGPGYFEGAKANELPERWGEIRHVKRTYINRVNREPALTCKVPLTLQSKCCTDGAIFAREFEQRWHTALVEAEAKLRPLTRLIP